jgi:hypothetical protein
MLRAAVLLAAVARAAAQQGMPSQAQTDAQWALLPGGLATRPFVSSLILLPASGGAPQTIWSGVTAAAASPPAGHEATTGQLTAVVSPTNMCAAGQTPAQGVCYNPPNRVALALGLTTGGGNVNTDLSGALSPGDVLEITLTLPSPFSGDAFQWAWANGNVQLWNVSAGAASVTARIAPVATPVPDWSSVDMANQCCTCDMPANCPLARASAFTQAAGFFIQMAPPGQGGPLAGAVFATTNAVMGGLGVVAGGGGSGGRLDYALASAHAAPDGSNLTGTLTAFVPAAALAALFPGVAAADAASALNVTRTGDPGTQTAVTVAPVAAATFGGEGIMVTVTGVTFSAPTYQVALRSSGGPSGANGGGSSAAMRAAPLLLPLAALAAALLL